MARVYLVRHGEAAAAWGGDGADPGLSELGRRQAAAAAEALAGPALKAAFTSPMRRCRETAEPFEARSGVAARVEPAVAEIPTPAGLAGPERTSWLRHAAQGTWAEIAGGDYAAWRDGVAHAVARAGAGSDAVVFTHFVAINAAVSWAQGSDRVVVFRPANASLTVLDTDGAALTLVALGREAETAVL